MKTLREYIEAVEESYEDPQQGDYFDLEIARDETLIETYVVDVREDGIVIEADDTILQILRQVGYLAEGVNLPPAEDSTSPINGKKDSRNYNFETSVDTDLNENEPGDYPHSGSGVSPNMQMAIDIARMQAKTNMLRSMHGDTFQDKPMPDYDEDKVQLVPGQKPGTYQATVRMRQRQAPPQPTNEAEYRGRNVPLGKKMAGDVKKSKVYVRKPNGNIVKVEFGDPNMRIKKSNPKRRKSFRARHNCDNPGPRWKARYWSCRSW